MRYGILLYVPIETTLPRKMAPKWRIVFLHVNIAQETLHLAKTAQTLEISIALMAAYKPYTQSPEHSFSVLVTFGLLWLQLSDTYRKVKP